MGRCNAPKYLSHGANISVRCTFCEDSFLLYYKYHRCAAPKKNDFFFLPIINVKEPNIINIQMNSNTKTSEKNQHVKSTGDEWVLRLYVAGQTPKSISAFKNLKAICEDKLDGKYEIEVIDLLVNPQLAGDDQIFATPTLVRKLPIPVRKIIGDLSDTERVLVGLDLFQRSISNESMSNPNETI